MSVYINFEREIGGGRFLQRLATLMGPPYRHMLPFLIYYPDFIHCRVYSHIKRCAPAALLNKSNLSALLHVVN